MPMNPKLVISMGYQEDNWNSSSLHAEQLYHAVSQNVVANHVPLKPVLFGPEVYRTPRWFDRRLLYPHKLPQGEIFHLIDPAYGDSLLRAKSLFRHTMVTVTDIAFARNANQVNQFFRHRITKGIAEADLRVAISRHTAREMQETLGLKPDRIVYLGVDPESFTHSDQPRENGLLLHVGTTDARKGLERLFPLLAKLPQQYRLLQVGGTFSPAQEEMLQQLGIRHRVTQVSYLTKAQLIAAYHRAAALVFPSLYEGYGLPCVEARLCGTPILISREVPAYETLAQDPGTRVADFTGEETIEKILALPSAPIALKNRAWFGWDRVAREMVAIYQELQAGHSTRQQAG